MSYRFSAAIVIAAVSLSVTTVPANLLSNPGFEIGLGTDLITDWTRSGDAKRESWAGRSGDYGLAFYGWASSGLAYQDVHASGVSNYTFTAYGLQDALFTNTLTVEMKLEFKDSDDVTIGTITNFVTCSTAWSQFTIAARSPEGTVLVRPVFAFSGTAGSGGAFKWDDVELTSTGFLTHYVSTIGSNTPPYTNWGMAANDIQSAIDFAADGEIVLVSNGTYTLTTQLVVTNGIIVRGLNGSDTAVVDGNNTTRCFFIDHPDAVIRDLQVQNGRISSTNDHARGGGVYCAGGLLRDCTIISNSVSSSISNGMGGGVYCDGDAVVRSCRLAGNTVSLGHVYGGGVYCSGSSFVEDSLIDNNTISAGELDLYYGGNAYGGGVYCASSGKVNRCVIRGNTALGGSMGASGSGFGSGGGVYCSSGEVQNCLIIENLAEGGPAANGRTASGNGGGVFFSDGGVLRNCTVSDNTAKGGSGAPYYPDGPSHGGGVYCDNGGILANTIIYYNTADTGPNLRVDGTGYSYTYCCVHPATGGTGNIADEPRFADMSGSDYRLPYGSPCIDTGMALTAITNDLGGTPRPIDGDFNSTAEHDMGAYEYDPLLTDDDGDFVSDYDEVMVYYTSPTNFDTDSDGMGDRAEIMAGTSPTNSSSKLDVQYTGPASWDGNGIVVQWPCVAGKEYTLLRSIDLSSGFSALASNITATPTVNSYTDTTATASGPYYFRVQVEGD